MPYLNISGYKFIHLEDLTSLETSLMAQCKEGALKGTILLSPEGINISLSGLEIPLAQFTSYLKLDARFSDLHFRASYSSRLAFKRLKVKIKKEIITFKNDKIDATKKKSAAINPALLKHWLDAKQNITLLDTRNEYEIKWGTFNNAHSLGLSEFSQFPEHLAALDKTAVIVMFCTGGIRCEKAALHMQEQGFSHVYQLEGGILNYFAQVGGAHYHGNCFVFDDRIAVNSASQEVSIPLE